MKKVLLVTGPAGHPAQVAYLVGVGALLPVGLIWFYLAAAVRPLSRRSTSAGWIVSTIYHAVAAWLLVAVLHETLTVGHLPLPLLSISSVDFLVSLFMVACRSSSNVTSGLPVKNTA